MVGIILITSQKYRKEFKAPLFSVSFKLWKTTLSLVSVLKLFVYTTGSQAFWSQDKPLHS